jgi:hypothetical protein
LKLKLKIIAQKIHAISKTIFKILNLLMIPASEAK